MSDPKLIINLNLTDSELAEKVNIAVDKYIEDVCQNKINDFLDNKLERYINERVDYLLGNSNKPGSYYQSQSIEGIKYKVREAINKKVNGEIDEAIIKLVAKKINKMIEESAKSETGSIKLDPGPILIKNDTSETINLEYGNHTVSREVFDNQTVVVTIS